MTFSDSQLKAYLDGALEPTTADALERAMEQDTDLEARLMALEPLAAPIRSAFEDLPSEDRLEEFLPEAPRKPDEPMNGARRAFMAGGVAAACVALGFGVASLVRPSPDLAWQEQVAIYQALYGPETVAHIDSTPNDLAAQFARASAALGRDISVADVSGVEGLRLRRAQVLNFQGTPLVQVVYSSDAGIPVAFCILAMADGGAATPQFGERAGLQTSHWADGAFGYMVLGRLDRAELGAITEQLHAVF